MRDIYEVSSLGSRAVGHIEKLHILTSSAPGTPFDDVCGSGYRCPANLRLQNVAFVGRKRGRNAVNCNNKRVGLSEHAKLPWIAAHRMDKGRKSEAHRLASD